MNTSIDCIPCFVRQALEAARFATDDPAIHEQVLRDVMALSSKLDLHLPPPAVGRQIHRRIRELTGRHDPYRNAKDRYNTMALELMPQLRQRVAAAGDPFLLAVRFAIAGNIIDLGVKSDIGDQTILESIDNVLDGRFVGNIEAFRQAVAHARSILYLADNAGEIVLDRLLIEQLPLDRTTVAVRGGPVINDATIEDARAAGLEQLVEVIDNGCDVPGTILSECSQEFRRKFKQASLIISKGQGNFETLCDEDYPLFFLFKVKCPVIAEKTGFAVGTQALLRQGSTYQPQAADNGGDAGESQSELGNKRRENK